MANKLMLDRQTLARLFQNDHQAIVAFEKVLGGVGDTLPSTIEEVTALANMAVSLSNLALALLSQTSEQLELLSSLPAPVQPIPQDEYTPAIAFGTIGQQNADSVEITGGSIDGTTIGATSASTGAFTTLTASGAVTLSPANANVVLSPTGTGLVTIAPATAGAIDNIDIGATTPKTVKSTTLTATGAVALSPANLNVVLSPTGTGVVTISPATLGTMDKVAIGGTTPAAAAVTTLTASAAVTLSPANAAVTISPSGTGAVVIAPNAASTMDNVDIGATTAKTVRCTTLTTTGAFSLFNGLIFSSGATGIQFKGSSSTANAEAFFQNDNAALILHASSSGAVVKTLNFRCTGSGTDHMILTSTGLTVAGRFGCNGQAEQAAYAVGAAAVDLATVITLANNIRLALIANGIAS